MMRLSRWHLFTGYTLLLLCFAAGVLGQAPGTGAISGLVLDPAGHGVEAATVIVADTATHTQRQTGTSAAGAFNVPLLSPGAYTITVSHAGFVAPQTEVRVTVSETSFIRFSL